MIAKGLKSLSPMKDFTELETMSVVGWTRRVSSAVLKKQFFGYPLSEQLFLNGSPHTSVRSGSERRISAR